MSDPRRALFCGAIAALLLLTAAGAEAATFTVNTTNDIDDGTCNATHCSLREAIAAANAVPGTSFAFLIILSQLVRYDWAMDVAAMVFAAGPTRCFLEITFPIIWPCLFGAFLISFILAFNNLEISFYNLGAIPTLPSVAWGSLRFGLGPELFALAALVNFIVFAIFVVMYLLMRYRIVSFGYRGA